MDKGTGTGIGDTVTGVWIDGQGVCITADPDGPTIATVFPCFIFKDKLSITFSPFL